MCDPQIAAHRCGLRRDRVTHAVERYGRSGLLRARYSTFRTPT
jgi:hypothetical protein